MTKNKALMIMGQPGAGKTQYFINSILPDLVKKRKNILIVNPSQDICDQSYNDIRAKYPYYHTKQITTKSLKNTGAVDQSVTSSIYAALNDRTNQIVLCTIQAFNLVCSTYYKNWQVVIDDPLPIISEEIIRIIKPFKCDDIFTINEKKKNLIGLTEISKRFIDEQQIFNGNSMFGDNFYKIISQINYGKCDYYLQDTKKNSINSEHASTTHFLLGVPKKTYFPSDVILIGDDVNKHEWVVVNKIDHDTIQVEGDKNLNRKIKIRYYLKDANNTKYFKENYSNDYNRVINHILNDSTPALYLNNVSYGKFKVPSNWTKLSSNCYGMNSYTNYDRVVITLSSNMRKETQEKTIEQWKVSNNYLFERRMGQIAYQTASRSSIRDKNSDRPVIIDVIDHRTAKFLYDKWNSCFDVTLEYIDLNLTYNDRILKSQNKWTNKSETVKATNIVKNAKNGYYSDEINARILSLDKDRIKIKELSIWNKVTTRGTYKN